MSEKHVLNPEDREVKLADALAISMTEFMSVHEGGGCSTHPDEIIELLLSTGDDQLRKLLLSGLKKKYQEEEPGYEGKRIEVGELVSTIDAEKGEAMQKRTLIQEMVLALQEDDDRVESIVDRMIAEGFSTVEEAEARLTKFKELLEGPEGE